ncbi:hypothetical protein NDU88_010216 [Pleurodeles waltl]|uniref:Uncharacterized protein n=1 Tax=Pleurodeles waltl TaxID=8319 RepID=A0AAV7QY15_PLEWA|nr:hypothetical protein NDU88_010216 [Pleurodeles waltl]
MPPASRTHDRAASVGVRRGGRCLLRTLSGCCGHRWQLSSQASYGQGDPVIQRSEEHQEHWEAHRCGASFYTDWEISKNPKLGSEASLQLSGT